MEKCNQLEEKIWRAQNSDFWEFTMELFEFQCAKNPIYQKFITHRSKTNLDYATLPYLPVQLFKDHIVTTAHISPTTYFETSGTTANRNLISATTEHLSSIPIQPGRHYIHDLSIYDQSIALGFKQQYGPVEDYIFIGLLPTYIERPHASLIYMVKTLMKLSYQAEEYFFLYDYKALDDQLLALQATNKKIMLWGVSFALLDWSAATTIKQFNNLIIMETGGMKGRRKEIVKEELHSLLYAQLPGVTIHSEYGMTELLSQAFALDGIHFTCPNWMKVIARDIYDPYSLAPEGQSGIIRIIDFANIYSCPFIETADIGKVYEDGRFVIQGRIDHSDIRGCNLLVS